MNNTSTPTSIVVSIFPYFVIMGESHSWNQFVVIKQAFMMC